MKILKTYKIFMESDFVGYTDPGTKQVETDEIEDLENQLKDYMNKKSKIDQLYSTKDEIAKDSIEKIINDNKNVRNPFLFQYSIVASLKKRIEILKDGIIKNRIKIDNYKEELELTSDSSTKNDINTKIGELNKKISTATTDITKITKEITEKEKEFKDNMTEIEKKIKDNKI